MFSKEVFIFFRKIKAALRKVGLVKHLDCFFTYTNKYLININAMATLTENKSMVVSEEERAAIAKIKNWVTMICRNKCSDTNQIYVSPYQYENSKGETVRKTLICISDNLPDGPVVQVPKSLTEVNLEDLLGCYKLINYCRSKK